MVHDHALLKESAKTLEDNLTCQNGALVPELSFSHEEEPQNVKATYL